MSILVVNLSIARHLDSFATNEILIYLSPRIKDDLSKLEFHCSLLPQIDMEIERIEKLTKLQISVIVTYVDVFGFYEFVPRFEKCNIPVVAILGDTHHGKGTILKVNSYLRKNRIRHICLKQTKGQEDLFTFLGYNTYCFPCYLVNPTIISPSRDFEPVIVAYGSYSEYHYRRNILISMLKNIGLPVMTGRVPRSDMFEAFNRSSITLNIPLNSDVNYRFHEAVAVGGCLLTEQLGSVSSKNEVLERNIHYFDYSNFGSLVEQCKYLLADRKANYAAREVAHADIHKAVKEASIAFVNMIKRIMVDPFHPETVDTEKLNKVKDYEKNLEKARCSLVSPNTSIDSGSIVPWRDSFNRYDYRDIASRANLP